MQNQEFVESRAPRRRGLPPFSWYAAIPLLAVTGLLIWWLYRLSQWVADHIGVYWSQHWPWIVGIGGVLLFLFVLLPQLWRGWVTLAHHQQKMADFAAHRSLILASSRAMEIAAQRGHNIEMTSAAGHIVRTINPASVTPASKTANNYYGVSQLEAGDEGERYEDGEEEDIEQPTIEEIVAAIPPNSYQMCLGRSLTTGELIIVSLKKKHLKFIGASQRGKSSAAAALMRTLTLTHDPQHVQLALLDLENQTCHLFEDAPHVLRVNGPDGWNQPLIARDHEEVAGALVYLVQLMNARYEQTKTEVTRLPLIVIYLEEVLSLKDFFKSRKEAKIKGADADYANLMFNIKELARRGLKVRMQLLACTQADYRDADLVEAWVNIKAGLSFSVRLSAAQAAGFTQTELLKQNAEDDLPGQFVCETSEVKDLGLAPFFDLEYYLMQWEAAQEQAEEAGPAHSTRPLHGAYGTMRPFDADEGRAHSDSDAGMEDRNYPYGNGDDGDCEDAHKSVMRSPVEPAHTTHGERMTVAYPLLNDLQCELFCTAYRLTGNIDQSLREAGANTRYRDHARSLIAERQLRKEAK